MTAATFNPQSNAALGMGSRIFSDTKELSFFCKDIVQGFLSGLMVIAGSTQVMAGDLTNAVAALPAGIDGAFIEDLFSGRMMGGVQIAAAALLFISARRGLARTIGILALIGYVAFQNMGFTGEDLLSGASQGLRTLADTLEAAGMSTVS